MTDSLLHDITLLERQLHGIITQRERLGVSSKEMEATEEEIKKNLAEKKKMLRNIMEEGEPPKKPPRELALIKNGVTLEMLEQIIQIEDKLCSTLPVIEVKPLDSQILGTLSGPTMVNGTPDDGAPNLVSYPSEGPSRFAACSLSTYPHVQPSSGPERQGDPLCDRFCVHVHNNGAVVALADGCNWGRLPFEAANRATNAFIQYLEERLGSITSVRGAGSVLLAALSAANKKIMEGLEQWECGTTTLIGGLFLPLLSSSSHAPPLGSLPRSSSWSSSNSLVPNMLLASPGRTRAGSTSCTGQKPQSSAAKWVFVCVSLGDCKAFHYSQRTQEFTDITEGNRQNLTDARDPGGRLGPYIEADPDLRNLHLYYHFCEPDDIIFLMSDGIHDNLDPQQLGVPPSDAKIAAATWEEAEQIDSARVEVFKNDFRRKWLEDTFAKHKLLQEKETSNKMKKLDVKTLVDVLLQHCVNITKSSRDFMEQNPKQKLPPDFKTYPGKLDHATCVCVCVGNNEKK